MHARVRTFPPLLALALACATPVPPPELPGLVTSPVEIGDAEVRITNQAVVLLDGSGTMHDRGSFSLGSQLARSFVAGLPSPDAPTRSGAPTDYLASFTGFRSTSFLPGVPAAAPYDPATLRADADGFASRTETFTPIPYVLRLSHDAVGAGELRKAVVIFSDGLGDNGSGPNEALQQEAIDVAKALVQESAGEVCLWAVHVGQDLPTDEVSGEKLMRDLGALTACGGFRKGEELAPAAGGGDGAGVLQLVRDVMLGPGDVAPSVPTGPGITFSLNFLFNQYSLCYVRSASDAAEAYAESLAANRQREERPGPCPDALGPRQLRAFLPKITDALRRNPDEPIFITGRTDPIDTAGYNQCLSELRAWEVRSYIAEQLAADPDAQELFLRRSRAVGLGEADPLRQPDGQDDPLRRAEMRRSEILTKQLPGDFPAGVQPLTSPPTGLAECRARR